MDGTLEAKWVVDSETSGEVLIDCKTGDIIGRKDKYGKWVQQ